MRVTVISDILKKKEEENAPRRRIRTPKYRSSAKIDDVPPSLLKHVFLFLEVTEVLKCRQVCKQWRTAVNDLLPDMFWLELCGRDFFDIYEESYRRSGLTWRELYSSLVLWPKVAEAKVTVRYIKKMKATPCYYFLKGSNICCPHRLTRECPADMRDTITYCDLKEMKIVLRRPVGYFKNYYENDVIIVTDYNRDEKTNLRTVAKLPYGTETYEEVIVTDSKWIVYRFHLYYQAKETGSEAVSIWRSKVTIFDNLARYYTTKLCDSLGGEIEDVTFKDGDINICRSIEGRLTILGIFQGQITANIELDNKDTIERLISNCFDWTTPNIFKMVRELLPEEPRIVTQDIHAPVAYGEYVIAATSKAPIKLMIFHKPYDQNGRLCLDTATPLRTIVLDDYLEGPLKDVKNPTIESIGVLECYGGHMIVALYCGKILVVKLSHPHEIFYGKGSSRDRKVYYSEGSGEASGEASGSASGEASTSANGRETFTAAQSAQSAVASTSRGSESIAGRAGPSRPRAGCPCLRHNKPSTSGLNKKKKRPKPEDPEKKE